MLEHNAFEYSHKQTIIHKLPVKYKLLALLTIVILINYSNNIILLALLTCFSIIFYIAAGFNFIDFIKDIKFVLYLFAAGLIFWIVFNYRSFEYLSVLFFEIILFFSSFALFLRTTNIQELLFGLRFFLPYKIIFAIGISIRFLPILSNELKNIILLQKHRGGKYDLKSIITGNAVLSIIIPLIVRCVKISEHLTIYAYVKKFGFSKKRTYICDSKKYKKLFESE